MPPKPEDYQSADQEAFESLLGARGGRLPSQGKVSDLPEDAASTVRWVNDSRSPAPADSPGLFLFQQPSPETPPKFLPFHEAYEILAPLSSTNRRAATLLARFPPSRLPENAPPTPPQPAEAPAPAPAGDTPLQRRKAKATPAQLAPVSPNPGGTASRSHIAEGPPAPDAPPPTPSPGRQTDLKPE